MTREQIIKEVNNVLSNYWWGGEVVDARLNRWNEWIVDCKIYLIGEWGDKCYNSGDYVVKQYMAYFYEVANITLCNLYPAKNEMRLPTFREECGILDDDAPKSPYIIKNLQPDREAMEINPF